MRTALQNLSKYSQEPWKIPFEWISRDYPRSHIGFTTTHPAWRPCLEKYSSHGLEILIETGIGKVMIKVI
jgi:hypothetical protein